MSVRHYPSGGDRPRMAEHFNMVLGILLFCSVLALGACMGIPGNGAVIFHLVPHGYKGEVPPPAAPASPLEPAEEFSPFSYMYNAVSGKGSHSRLEDGDSSGKVKGSYSLTHKDGNKRMVDYTASGNGFFATIRTNEHGIIPGSNPADVSVLGLEGASVLHDVLPSASAGKAIEPVQSPPSPFSFMYTAGAGTGSTSRSENGDETGNVKGSYSLKDEDGRQRIVKYTAGLDGFMAKIQSNEPGVEPGSNPADVEFLSIPGVAAIPAAAPASPASDVAPVRAAVPAPPASVPELSAPPSPFSFMYTAGAGTGSSSRSESGDETGNVKGSYSLKDEDGRQRIVKYTAGLDGFMAKIQSNEPGVEPGSNPADVEFLSIPGVAAIPAAAPASPASDVTPVRAAVPAPPASVPELSVPPSPFSFMYTAGAGTGSSSRSESGDETGNVKGSYSLKDEDGRQRIVKYTAGLDGFMAKIQSNEPGVEPGSNPADVEFLSIPGVAAPASPASDVAPVRAAVPGPPASVPKLSAPPSPFSFMYTAGAGTGSTSRSESGDETGNVKGSYSLKDEDGRQRIVKYTAGLDGFMAKIQSNEPGVEPGSNPADVEFLSIPGVAAIPAAAPAPAAPALAAAVKTPAASVPLMAEPNPFAFMYTADAGKGSSSRSESGEAGAKIKGSYSLHHASGHQRTVDYSANGKGFIASIKSNEPGVKPGDNPADVTIYSLPEVAAAVAQPDSKADTMSKPISAKELFAAAKYAPVSPSKLANYVWHPKAIVVEQ
ncbi:uncharacterized protein LOC143254233 isoform X1 [Tachypleus tridentatus]|uniref:uncharacterized protein LOC143254233 isoform X1 n=1 Tax=Tachypleus tridentatus TaxID=6853 RepID=UPI003FD5FB5A